MHERKYIFITGGVISGLGKGIIASSIGKMLQSYGYSVAPIKIDPYINIDAGTMRPTEHGEVWVTEEGGEIDQDLGNYERFLDVTLYKKNNLTTGKIFREVIQKERSGEYLGKTVQPIPHVTDEIKKRIRKVGEEENVDFVITEIGGTVGDYENVLFLEAARQIKQEDPAIIIHTTYLPIPEHLGEMKTKPTQHAIKEIEKHGINPDFIACRSEEKIDEVRRNKINQTCSIEKDKIFSVQDTDNVYKVPIILSKQEAGKKILKEFELEPKGKMKEWKDYVDKIESINDTVDIGIIGKYFDTGKFNLTDSYISVIEAIKHASWENDVNPKIKWIDSKKYEKDEEELKELSKLDGVIVPGGFGKSGVEGKISAIKYCRENNIPYLGLCYGMQLALVEYARNVCELDGAHSTEIDENAEHPVIDLLPEQKEKIKDSNYGATMRLGGQEIHLIEGTEAYNIYGSKKIKERFRHRYEVNPEYIDIFEENGVIFSGENETGRIMQLMELPDHKFFMASQFHPEFTSRLMKPNSMFKKFIEKSKE